MLLKTQVWLRRLSVLRKVVFLCGEMFDCRRSNAVTPGT